MAFLGRERLSDLPHFATVQDKESLGPQIRMKGPGGESIFVTAQAWMFDPPRAE